MALGNCVEVKGILPSVGQCRYWGGQAISCVGVHSSMVELTRLAILPFHFLSSVRNPVAGWFDSVLMCVSYFLSSLRNPAIGWFDCVLMCVSHFLSSL